MENALNGFYGRRVVVTGARGFVGSYLIPFLRARGWEVVGVTRSDADRIPSQCGERWVRIDDPYDSESWARVLADTSHVVHLAALAHQLGASGENRSAEFQRANATVTEALAHAAAGVRSMRRVLLVSTVAAVADSSAEILDEETACRPKTDYGKSKLEAERRLQAELAGCDVDWCIVRPPLVYGPGNPGNMARLLRLVESRLPLPLSSFHGRRSLVYVGNLVDALEHCLFSHAAARQVFMISDGQDLSTPDLVRLIAAARGIKAPLFSVPVGLLYGMGRALDWLVSIGGRRRRVFYYSVDRLNRPLRVNSTKIGCLLEWRPPVQVEEAVRRTVVGNEPSDSPRQRI